MNFITKHKFSTILSMVFLTFIAATIIIFAVKIIQNKIEKKILSDLLSNKEYEYQHVKLNSIMETTIVSKTHKIILTEISKNEKFKKTDTIFVIKDSADKTLFYRSVYDNPKLIPLIIKVKKLKDTR